MRDLTLGPTTGGTQPVVRARTEHPSPRAIIPHTNRPYSPHRAVRPGPDLFELGVLLRDLPHRVVDFLSGEMSPRLHTEEEQAKLRNKSKTKTCLLPSSAASPVTRWRRQSSSKHTNTRRYIIISGDAFQNKNKRLKWACWHLQDVIIMCLIYIYGKCTLIKVHLVRIILLSLFSFYKNLVLCFGSFAPKLYFEENVTQVPVNFLFIFSYAEFLS